MAEGRTYRDQSKISQSLTDMMNSLREDGVSSDSERILTNLLNSSESYSDFFNREGESTDAPEKRVGETVRIACLDIGSYRPQDMVWKVEGKHVLVQGKRVQRINHGVEGAKFRRAIPIPEEVDPKRITTRFSSLDGQYIIEGVKFKTDQCGRRKTSSEYFDEAKMTLTVDLGSTRAQELVYNSSATNSLSGDRRVFNPKTDKIVI